MKELISQYDYSPSEKVVTNAFRLQAVMGIKFRLNPSMDIKAYETELEKAFAPLKYSVKTQKYSLDELAMVAQFSEDQRIKELYSHESIHALQIEKALTDMGITEKPSFTVYFVPIEADMFQWGKAVGLIETSAYFKSKLTRKQIIELNRRVAIEMAKSVHNSSGDILIISSTLFGEIIGFISDRFVK